MIFPVLTYIFPQLHVSLLIAHDKVSCQKCGNLFWMAEREDATMDIDMGVA